MYFGTYLTTMLDGRLLIGAHCFSPRPDQYFAGRAYLFDANGVRLATFANPTPARDDHFGQALSGLGADRVLITAPDDDTGAPDSGCVYLFDTNGTLLVTILNPTPYVRDKFGSAVARNGTSGFVVGAPYDDTAALDAGAVYLYNDKGDLLRTLTAPVPAEGECFGAALAPLPGGGFVVGAPGNDTGAEEAGCVYAYDINGELVATLTNPAAQPFAHFGLYVSAAGSSILVSAPNDDTGAPDAGVVYCYRFSAYMPGLEAEYVRNPGPAILRDGSVTSNKLAAGAVTTKALAIAAVQPVHLQVASFSNTFWKTDGNANIVAGTHFLGTTDNRPLEIRVNNQRVLRLEPDPSGNPRVIGGRDNNAATGTGATVGGGYLNRAFAAGATIAGGSENRVEGVGGVVGGGVRNVIGTNTAAYATICGGYQNQIGMWALGAVIGVGSNNRAEGQGACIPGGLGNRAGSCSFAAGTLAYATNTGCFVWADDVGGSFSTTADRQFLIRARNGVGIGTNKTSRMLTVAGDAFFSGPVQAAEFRGSGAGLTGITGGSIQDGSITSLQLASGSVGTSQLANGAVSGSKLAANAVTSDKIADAAVDSTDLAVGAVTETRIAAGAVTQSKLAANSVTGDKIVNGTIGAADVNSSDFNAVFWRVGGNTGTTPGVHYVGTSDNQALELKVNAQRVWRAEPHATSPRLVAGYCSNSVAASAYGSVISGGGQPLAPNRIEGIYGTIGGGSGNATGTGSGWATVCGGRSNQIDTNASYSMVCGGWFNRINPLSTQSVIGSGGGNIVGRESYFGVISGGEVNRIGDYAGQTVIGGGSGNVVSNNAVGTVIGGGLQNSVGAAYAAVLGGAWNAALGSYAVVSGGENNRAVGNHSTVPGGSNCRATGDHSFAAGNSAHANHNGAFVWSDNSGGSFSSDRDNQFKVRCHGGSKFVTGETWSGDVGVYLPANGVSWSCLCDRRMKENLAPVDAEAIAAKLDTVPICTWNLVTQNPSIRHIGPTAQDFYEAFGVGETNTMISTTDGIGVALAAAQGLSLKVQRLTAALAASEQRVAELEARVTALEARLGKKK